MENRKDQFYAFKLSANKNQIYSVKGFNNLFWAFLFFMVIFLFGEIYFTIRGYFNILNITIITLGTITYAITFLLVIFKVGNRIPKIYYIFISLCFQLLGANFVVYSSILFSDLNNTGIVTSQTINNFNNLVVYPHILLFISFIWGFLQQKIEIKKGSYSIEGKYTKRTKDASKNQIKMIVLGTAIGTPLTISIKAFMPDSTFSYTFFIVCMLIMGCLFIWQGAWIWRIVYCLFKFPDFYAEVKMSPSERRRRQFNEEQNNQTINQYYVPDRNKNKKYEQTDSWLNHKK